MRYCEWLASKRVSLRLELSRWQSEESFRLYTSCLWEPEDIFWRVPSRWWRRLYMSNWSSYLSSFKQSHRRPNHDWGKICSTWIKSTSGQHTSDVHVSVHVIKRRNLWYPLDEWRGLEPPKHWVAHRPHARPSPFESETQAITSKLATRSVGEMTRHKATRLLRSGESRRATRKIDHESQPHNSKSRPNPDLPLYSTRRRSRDPSSTTKLSSAAVKTENRASILRQSRLTYHRERRSSRGGQHKNSKG